MEKEPRKATDVLLELESNVKHLIDLVKNQDFLIKVLSNKINELISTATLRPKNEPKNTVEAVNSNHLSQNYAQSFVNSTNSTDKNILISSEYNLPMEESPNGFRRTSRPETYSDSALQVPLETKFPMQIPHKSSEIIVPNDAMKKPQIENVNQILVKKPQVQALKNAIPVSQRVVDRNGKAVFLADVEIMDMSSGNSIYKNRTNGAGKWMAPLEIGNYRVIIRKRESVTKEKIEVGQDIVIDGSLNKVDLQTLIIK